MPKPNKKVNKKYDKDGKLYIWSDPRFYIHYIQDQVYLDSSMMLAGDELDKLADSHDEIMNVQKNVFFMTPEERNSLHGVVNEGSRVWISSELKLSSYLDEGDLEKTVKFINKCASLYEKKAKEVPADPKYDKIRRYFNDLASLSKADSGNRLEAYATKPYILTLRAFNAGAPKFDQLGFDAVIDGMNGATKSNGEAQPGFDIYMDMLASHYEELRTEYHRQELAADGWDVEKEATYLKELKATHERTVANFERMLNLENNGQYDEFLNNGLDEEIGVKEEGNNRVSYFAVGNIRGELRAIEMGWSSDELSVLGFVGTVEAEIERKKKQLANNPDALEALAAMEQDFKENLKDKVWNVNGKDMDAKLRAVEVTQAFFEKYKNNNIIGEPVRMYADSFVDGFEKVKDNVAFVKREWTTPDDDEFLSVDEKEKRAVFDSYMELEKKGDWEGIINKALERAEKEMSGDLTDNEMEGFERYCFSFLGERNFVREDRREAYNKLCSAMGENRAKYAIQAGKEVEEIKERMKRGEIKGVEAFIDNDKALNDIAMTYVNNTSKAIYDMNLVPNSWLPLHMKARYEDNINGMEQIKAGVYGSLEKITDPEEKKEAAKYLETGLEVTNSSNRSRRYGLEFVESEGGDRNIFREWGEKKTIERFESVGAINESISQTDKLLNQVTGLYETMPKMFDEVKECSNMLKKWDGVGSNLDQQFVSLISEVNNAATGLVTDKVQSGMLNSMDQIIQNASAYVAKGEPDYRKLNAPTEEDLIIDHAANIKRDTERLVKGAAEDLKRLEKMQKKGHENGKEYNAMHKALKELAEFKADEGSYETLQTKLENLKTASEGYVDTHDKWYKASKGYGLDRLDMARHLKEMTEQAELRLKDFPKAYQDRPLGTLADELAKEKTERVEAAKQILESAKDIKNRLGERMPDPYAGQGLKSLMEELQSKKALLEERRAELMKKDPVKEDTEKQRSAEHRRLEKKEVDDMLKGDAPKHGRHGSVREPGKHPVMDGQVKHGVNDAMENNHGMKRTK